MRTINVNVTDCNGDVDERNLDFNFNTVEELDKDIDSFILNEMKITRADVLLHDFDACLTDEEVDFLTEKYYEFY
jgi:hypothetical protein